MCGIAGWYDPSPRGDGDRKTIRIMLDSMVHRGPDDSGLHLGSPARLGHNRLSIIDLTGGVQPMSGASGAVLAYNGEIYNYRELRERLESRGSRFYTRSDTEVVLAAFEQFGTACFECFNGMFALAIWDPRERRLVLCRDRLGIKPLYLASLSGGRWVFASDVKAILAFPGMRRDPDLCSVNAYLSFRRPLGDATFFRSIQSVPAGAVVTISDDGRRDHRYWSLPTDEYESVDDELLYGRTEELLESAVRSRMISDVPFGAFLSGGLDSSYVVSAMSRASDSPIRTYSVGFADPDYNELEPARRVAAHFGTEHHELVLGESGYLAATSSLIRMKAAPLSVPNEIAIYELSKLLKRDITVVLSGEGADELFVGYGRLFASAWDYERLVDPSFASGPCGGAFMRRFANRYGKAGFGDEVSHLLHLYEYTRRPDRRRLFTRDAWEHLDGDSTQQRWIREAFSRGPAAGYPQRCVHFFQWFHLENLLRRVDAMTMAASVEARVPFVDHELVEHVARIPFRRKLPWKSQRARRAAMRLTGDAISEVLDTPKHILKVIARKTVPAEIVERKKMGFPVPLDRYCGGDLVKMAREILGDAPAAARGVFDPAAVSDEIDRASGSVGHQEALRLWMLVNVEMWFREFVDGVGSIEDRASSELAVV